MLVACKWENFALRWTLSEAGCFQQRGATNYKLSNKDAVISNLMFALAGNFALVFREGTSWHSQWKRLTPTKRIAGKRNSFSMTVRPEGDSFYTNASGARIEAPDSLLWTFFMGQPEPFSEEGDIVNLRFATPKNTFQSADRVFEEIITPGRKPPYWRELLCNYGIPNHASSIREVAARRSDIVEKVLIMNPRKMPDFLGGEK